MKAIKQLFALGEITTLIVMPLLKMPRIPIQLLIFDRFRAIKRKKKKKK